MRPEQAVQLREGESIGRQQIQRQPPLQLLEELKENQVHICYKCVDPAPVCFWVGGLFSENPMDPVQLTL